MILENCNSSIDVMSTLFPGKTAAEIGQKLGTHRSNAWRKQHGITVLTHDDKVKLIELFNLDDRDQLKLFKL